MPACHFEHDYFKGVEMPLPELQKLRQSAFLLGLDALHQAAHGKNQTAVEDVAAMFGIARHIHDPVMISFLTAANMEKDAARVLSGILSLTQPRPEDLARLTFDEKTSYRRYVYRCCQMEEPGVGLSLYALLFAPSLAGPSAQAVREMVTPENSTLSTEQAFGLTILQSPVYRVFFLSDDLAGYRRSMQRIQDLAERPYYEAAKDWQAFNQSLKTHPPGIFASIILPAADRCAAVAGEADAARQMSRLALTMIAFHAKNNKYPDRLDELAPDYVPSIPRDPFDGQPLRMKREIKGLLLYSIGRDLKDDGGVPYDAHKQGDIVFRLPDRK
jgi:hypothetical protein